LEHYIRDQARTAVLSVRVAVSAALERHATAQSGERHNVGVSEIIREAVDAETGRRSRRAADCCLVIGTTAPTIRKYANKQRRYQRHVDSLTTSDPSAEAAVTLVYGAARRCFSLTLSGMCGSELVDGLAFASGQAAGRFSRHALGST
jgi:hypothetical protein